jgi:hypothetical protein
MPMCWVCRRPVAWLGYCEDPASFSLLLAAKCHGAVEQVTLAHSTVADATHIEAGWAFRPAGVLEAAVLAIEGGAG